MQELESRVQDIPRPAYLDPDLLEVGYSWGPVL